MDIISEALMKFHPSTPFFTQNSMQREVFELLASGLGFEQTFFKGFWFVALKFSVKNESL